MAEGTKLTDPRARKQELVDRLARSRRTVSHGRAVIKSKLQVKTQLSRLFRKKPKAIFAGSVATGLALTLLLKRPRKTKKTAPKSAGLVLLGWLLTLAKPAAKAWVVARAKQLAADRIKGTQPGL